MAIKRPSVVSFRRCTADEYCYLHQRRPCQPHVASRSIAVIPAVRHNFNLMSLCDNTSNQSTATGDSFVTFRAVRRRSAIPPASRGINGYIIHVVNLQITSTACASLRYYVWHFLSCPSSSALSVLITVTVFVTIQVASCCTWKRHLCMIEERDSTLICMSQTVVVVQNVAIHAHVILGLLFLRKKDACTVVC